MARIVRIGKKRYAVGLSWGPLSPDRPLRPQAIEKARQSQNGLYAIFGDIEPMVGHCDQGGGVKAGVFVLAPLVAAIWPANTLLVVSLEGTMVGFQILNGLVYDDVCGTPDEIRHWFEGIAPEHKWDHVSSPWGADEVSSSAFFDSIRTSGVKPPRLRSVGEGRASAIKVAVLVLLVLLGFLAVSKVVRDRREMAARLALLSRHVIVRVTPPARIVPLGPFVAQCREAFERIPSEAAGWTVRSLVCGKDRIRILWKRSPGSGTIRDLERSLGTRVRLSGKNAARSAFPLLVPEYATPVEKLPSLNEARKDLASVLEYYNLDYQTAGESFLPGLPGGGGAGFSVALPDLPEGGLLSALSHVSGLSVRSLEWAGKSQWILKGELKHAPIILVHRRPGSGASGLEGAGPGGKPSGPLPVRPAAPRPVGDSRQGPLSGSPPNGPGTRPEADGKTEPGGAVLPPLRLPSR